ncbi:hypothetical protein GF312_21710 [Candidatus Poribacteria bacterium]|nr:hypothetical protein [Candidatus Poribacteria bacterium]
MKTAKFSITILMILFAGIAQAQETSEAIDFFMYGRLQESLIRDYYQFDDPGSLRLEYWYENWANSDYHSSEYKDHLHIEGRIPLYRRGIFMLDLPLQYDLIPVWAEKDRTLFGKNLSFLNIEILTRWTIAQGLKSMLSIGYNVKGDGEKFGTSEGRKISLLRGSLSYEPANYLSMAAGIDLDRYFYDTDENPGSYELSDRLYFLPIAMINWHPGNNFLLMLGYPYSGLHLSYEDIIKTELRASLHQNIDFGIRVKPVERLNIVLRFLYRPYYGVPVEGYDLYQNIWLGDQLEFTEKSFVLEIGRELNPAALASIGIRYTPEDEIEIKDKENNEIWKTDINSRLAFGVTFTVDLNALIMKQ